LEKQRENDWDRDIWGKGIRRRWEINNQRKIWV